MPIFMIWDFHDKGGLVTSNGDLKMKLLRKLSICNFNSRLYSVIFLFKCLLFLRKALQNISETKVAQISHFFGMYKNQILK